MGLSYATSATLLTLHPRGTKCEMPGTKSHAESSRVARAASSETCSASLARRSKLDHIERGAANIIVIPFTTLLCHSSSIITTTVVSERDSTPDSSDHNHDSRHIKHLYERQPHRHGLVLGRLFSSTLYHCIYLPPAITPNVSNGRETTARMPDAQQDRSRSFSFDTKTTSCSCHDRIFNLIRKLSC